jgi:hypothetical protein
MIIYVDIDNTICKSYTTDYSSSVPYPERIDKINKCYEKGDVIIYWTARGTGTGINWFHTTHTQLITWGCKFHELRMGKPIYDIFIDDKNINSERYFN